MKSEPLTSQDDVRLADEAMERYYRDRAATGDPIALAEAIYHANHLEWERGIAEWVSAFIQALERSRYDRCRGLLDVRPELIIATKPWQGLVSYQEGEYFAILSRHAEAREDYTEAIAAYDQALGFAPDDSRIHNNKGAALARRGDLEATRADDAAARASYERAIAAYDQALGFAPEYINALCNKGLALESLGSIARQGLAGMQFEEAVTRYRAALAVYTRVNRLAPNNENIRRAKERVTAILEQIDR